MPHSTCSWSRSRVNGFEIHTCSNGIVEYSIAPELGARIVSIRDLVAGREWIDGWTPTSQRRIWAPTDPSDFSTGPGAGIDECLPTVLPCHIDAVALGDHGELWNRPSDLANNPGAASVSCRWTLTSLPLAFSRVISITQNRIRFDYRIENLARESTPYQWAWHPLLTFEAGDELAFAHDPKTCLASGGPTLPWPSIDGTCDLSRADLAGIEAKCAKVFVGPIDAPHVQIRSRAGAGLDVAWPGGWIPYAGIWITRGGWKGLHHWAIEPTNVPMDRLSEAIARSDLAPLAWLQPGETRTWHVTLTLHSGR